MARPLNQQIAEAEARLARLNTKSRALETGQKIIVGAVILNDARKDARTRKWLVSKLEQDVSRDIDIKRLKPILDELKAMDSGPAPTSGKANRG